MNDEATKSLKTLRNSITQSVLSAKELVKPLNAEVTSAKLGAFVDKMLLKTAGGCCIATTESGAQENSIWFEYASKSGAEAVDEYTVVELEAKQRLDDDYYVKVSKYNITEINRIVVHEIDRLESRILRGKVCDREELDRLLESMQYLKLTADVNSSRIRKLFDLFSIVELYGPACPDVKVPAESRREREEFCGHLVGKLSEYGMTARNAEALARCYLRL